MVDLKFVDQHNIVACLETTDENAEFHQIVDFLSTCLINYALTVSPTIYASYIEQFWNTATSKTINSVKQIHVIVDGKAVVISESSVRSDLLFNDEDGIICLTNDEIFENLTLMGYEQLSTKLTFQKVLALETTKTTQALEIASLKSRVKQLEKKASKRTYKFKRLYRVGSTRRVESSNDEGLGTQEDASKRGRSIEDIDKDAEVSLVMKLSEVSAPETLTTAGIKIPVSTATPSTIAVPPPVITEVEITLAQTLVELKSAKSKVVIQEPVQSTVTTAPSTILKAKGITFRDAGETTTRTPTSVSSSSIKDKGKAKMVEPEVPLNKKDQIRLDEELARRLDAEEQEAARLERENVELQEQATLAKIEEWDNVQAMMDADYELCKRLQEQEQGELTIEEKSKLFMELMNERKRHFAKLRAEEKRRKPLTKGQRRNQMCTYLKNMGGFTHNQLKNKSYKEIQKAFDKTMGWINNFKPMDSEEVKDSEKKAKGSRKKLIGKKRAGNEQK
ncbi:hypothetical protein Tco_0260679 [Tanacetum coccineum]